MTPTEASKEKNQGIVYLNLYGDIEPLSAKPKFKIVTEKKVDVDLTVLSDSSPEKEGKRRRSDSDSISSEDDQLPIASPLKGCGELYSGNKSIPIFAKGKRSFTTEGMVQMLFNATNDDVKCREPPKQVQMNAVFLIDLRYIPLDDLRADGLPQYDTYGGKRTITVEVDDVNQSELKVEIISSQRNAVPSKSKLKICQLERLYHSWNVGKDNKYHRRIMHVREQNGAIVNNVACVQYVYEKEEVQFGMKPHKSSKGDKGVPYTRTKPSVVRNLDQKLTSVGPKDAVSLATQESGGVMKVGCLSDLPRGPRQGYYRKQLQKDSLPSHVQGGEKQDELLEVLLKMKTDKQPLVRKVSIEKENTTIVIASDDQLKSLTRFSTSEIDFCIVQIDPTFRLGPYECTPISYRDLLLKRKRTGKNPLRLGPVLIHYRKDQNTYSGFLQTLIDLKPELQGVLSTGTDGELALVNAIEEKLPNAQDRSLRCFRHLQENFKKALTSYGMAGMQREFTDEVFGKADGDGVYQPGLLDAESPLEFDVKLESLREEWKERGDSAERVFKWVDARADMMKTKMIASVRKAARLPPITKGSDIPSHFLTNDAESNNNRLKSVKKHTQSGFSGTIEAVRRLVDTENEEFCQAVAGVSEDYEIREEFQKFVVPDFLSRPQEERTRYIQKLTQASMEQLHAAEGPESFGWITKTVPDHSTPSAGEGNESDAELLNTGVVSLDLLDDDPRLETISSGVREAMVDKARLLLDNKSVWRGPPTSDGKPTFSVASFSQGRPNYVVMNKNTGSVECECANWKSLKICSHAIAVAEREDTLHEYLEFYSKQPMSKKRNLTTVSNLDVNVGPLGRKGRRVRKRSKTTPSATVTSLGRQQSAPATHSKYTLRWLSESRAYQCYGCNSAFRVPGQVPPPPEDVVATTKEYRSFMKGGKLQVHYGTTHYHLREQCIKEKNPKFNPLTDLELKPTDHARFLPTHEELLRGFGIIRT
ncbi:hypothetical protein ACROYT_G040483 [Oculina patagonica]